MKRLSKKVIYTIGIALLCGSLQAQSLDQAKRLYTEGKYAEAKPVFEKLVKQAPNNASYNHWYGVCCFETGELSKAEKHLSVAVKRKIQDAYRYLGDVYYQTYRFDEASDVYEEYIDLLTKKKQPTETVDAKLNLAEKASRMLDKVEDVQVIDSMVVDKNAFLSAYTLSEESGKLMYFQDFFETSEPVNSTVYMNQKGDKIYYAHPTDENHYCLFNQSLLIDKWGDEKQLPMNINSNEDDNYPFVLSDGVTIYYASKGNGTLGGYDLFITRYNLGSDNYLTPEQLGMPYNSPYNDYMMVIDEAKGLGWFVSDRYQPEDKVCVYLFIPNDNRSRVESDDIEVKRAHATLTSIQSTWKHDSNYENLIKLAHKEIPDGRVEIKKDFEFVINDNTVYYTMDDIKSPEAKNLYSKVVTLNKQIKEINNKLNRLRTTWNNSNNAKRDQLKPQILQAEDQLYELQSQPAELEKRARNAEINFLKKNR
ncbi:tetratricopeptide repeat protein [Parabacteroides chinchillae]|uniref:WD40-like Beta Propeller Repeat n=1 Tax=Parabacteroides chinchillae TaxID=871327 RepID=A0A8G2BYN3_9BACT|nr:tetratricopeptide repeat protein [Parabacteroides chinchillae]SEG21962.1 WD40-like Beta Propeller Repeat [Parabacteroides chinchillae]